MHPKIQDVLLNEARKKKVQLVVYLMNGVPVKGRIIAFDNFTILMEGAGRQSMIYKHAISTIIPGKELTDYQRILEAAGSENHTADE